VKSAGGTPAVGAPCRAVAGLRELMSLICSLYCMLIAAGIAVLLQFHCPKNRYYRLIHQSINVVILYLNKTQKMFIVPYCSLMVLGDGNKTSFQ
jgi:hypothetical protein